MSRPDAPRQPYPGLRPFEADEADLFFGRELHVDALLERLSTSHFVAVVGESGAGKSSLVRAGLLPALDAGFVVEAGADWRVAVLRPGGSPLAALADTLLGPGVLSATGGVPRREFALAELRRGPLGLVQLIRDAHLGQSCNVLIVVDQFEELFRYCRDAAQKDEASVFVELLLRASQQRDVPVFVVLTMRSDFVGDCARFRGLPETLNDNQYLTPRLTREQIASAIREPARVCGGTVDAALVDELCNAVGDDPDQLPLLQHLLMRVWNRASQQPNRPRLTSALGREMGGLHAALNDHARQVYESLDNEGQALARAMFKCLTDPLSHRRDLRRDALVGDVARVAGATVPATIAIADAFRAAGRHMLMPSPHVPLDADSRLDISHESLIRRWTTLTQWAREESVSARELQRISEEATRERAGDGELLSGRDLARAQDWLKQQNPTPEWAARYVTPDEFEATRDFLARSEQDATRRRHDEAKARRVRMYSVATTVALVVVIVLAVGVVRRNTEAERVRTQIAEFEGQIAADERDKANAEKKFADYARISADERRTEAESLAKAATLARAQAHARQLAVSSRVESDRDPELAVVLAREALLERDADDSDGQLESALRSSIARHVPTVEPNFEVMRSRNYIPGSEKNFWVDFSLSPANVSARGDVVVPSRTEAVLWRATGEVARRGHFDGTDVVMSTASFSPDARLIVTAAGKEARVWNASSGEPVGKAIDHDALINSVVFNRDGTRLITLSDDKSAKVEAVNANGTTNQCTLNGRGEFTMASFSRDEGRVVTIEHDNSTWQPRVWNLSNCSAQRRLEADDIQSLAAIKDAKWASFSPYGGWLGVVTTDGTAHILNTSVEGWPVARTVTPDVPYEFSREIARTQDYPAPLAWSSDDRQVAISGGDHAVLVAEIRGDAPPVRLRGHTGRIRSITFHPGESLLLTTSADKSARLWKLARTGQASEVLVLKGHRDAVASGAFLPGNAVVTAGDDGRVRRWRPTWSLTQTVRDAAKDVVTAPSPLSDGERSDGAAWPGLEKVIADRDNSCTRPDFAPDDGPLAYCPEENLVLIARAGDAPPIEVKLSNDARVESAHLSASGRVLALTFDDYSIGVFDARTGRPRASMRGHSARIWQVGFSADERFMASAATDATARVWDVARGAEIASVTLLDFPIVRQISFGRDGGSVVLDTGGGVVTTWRCYGCGDRELLLREVERRQVRSLTAQEQARFLVGSGAPASGLTGGRGDARGAAGTR